MRHRGPTTVSRLAPGVLISSPGGRAGALLTVLLLTLPGRAASREEARYVFAWKGVPVGLVTLALSPDSRRFSYTSRHLHTRGGHVGERTREESVKLDARGLVAGRPEGSPELVSQALWLWRKPGAPGCVSGREELSGREGPHCVTVLEDTRVEGTLFGQPFTARYGPRGRMVALDVGEARFSEVAPGTRLRAPPDLFVDGLPVERGGAGARGVLGFEPPWPLAAPRPAWLTDWREGPARALAREVNAAFADKVPGDADWSDTGEGEAGACLAHAARYAARAAARGQRVAVVQGLLVVDAGPARPHAWVRVGLAGGGVLELDPTSLDEVRPTTHLALAVVEPGRPAVEAGERWLALLRGEHRVVRAAP